jgi:hypothetical protein
MQSRYRGDVSVTNSGPDSARNVVLKIAQDPVVGARIRFDDPKCSSTPAAFCNIAEVVPGVTLTIDVTSDLFQNHRSAPMTLSSGVTTNDVDYDLSNNDRSVSGSVSAFSSCESPDFGLPDPFVAGTPSCFVATAAYGTPFDSRLDVLRNFRDDFLLTNRPGRAFVDVYYRTSPPLADFIADRDWLRVVVRGALLPVIIAIEYPLMVIALIVAALLAFAVTMLRRGPGRS